MRRYGALLSDSVSRALCLSGYLPSSACTSFAISAHSREPVRSASSHRSVSHSLVATQVLVCAVSNLAIFLVE
jgi:membrane-bound metal-dependent hydrolase YbcI (DUF457 family)